MRCRCAKRAWIWELVALACHLRGTAGRMLDGSSGYSTWTAFGLQQRQPVPARGTCRLSWYQATAPSIGNTVLCNGSALENCLEPCMAGFSKLHSICIQQCPAEAAGPSRLCPISRTCIQAEGGVCPLQADVPFYCTVPDQFMGSCAKQSYQAINAPHAHQHNCSSGTAVRDVTGKWRCVEGHGGLPCSDGFRNLTGPLPGVGARCQQVCPPWLVDCGEACSMPGRPCSQAPEQLCPVVPSTSFAGCSLAQRSRDAIRQACAEQGFNSLSSCPLSLKMHGSCGGAKLEVAAGLRERGVLRQLEAWWGPMVGQEPLPDNYDGPLRAVRLTFSDKQAVVFGNASHALASSPRTTLKLGPNELVVGSDLWSSSSVMEGSSLTPLLAGFTLFTSDKRAWTAGGTTSWEGKLGSARLGAALSSWEQHVSLAGRDLGVGLPVGAAAYSSAAGIHAFGLVYLARTAMKQEL